MPTNDHGQRKRLVAHDVSMLRALASVLEADAEPLIERATSATYGRVSREDVRRELDRRLEEQCAVCRQPLREQACAACYVPPDAKR